MEKTVGKQKEEGGWAAEIMADILAGDETGRGWLFCYDLSITTSRSLG